MDPKTKGASQHKLPSVGGKMQRFWSKNGFRSYDGNSVFSLDLILNEVSELNGIVWIIVRSLCKQF